MIDSWSVHNDRAFWNMMNFVLLCYFKYIIWSFLFIPTKVRFLFLGFNIQSINITAENYILSSSVEVSAALRVALW